MDVWGLALTLEPWKRPERVTTDPDRLQKLISKVS